MSSEELRYDLDELKATADVAKQLIKSIKSSIKVLEAPEEYTHEEVSEAWVFVSGLKAACQYNNKLVIFGAAHGVISRTPGFVKRQKMDNPPVGLNPVFVDSRDDSENPDKKDLADAFIDFLESAMEKHKSKEE